MDLHLDSRFGLVTWLVMSNNAKLNCSRPDSKDGDGAGRYLMLPKATESAKCGGQKFTFKRFDFRKHQIANC